MQDYHGHNDFEEQRARSRAKDFERRLRTETGIFLDLHQVNEIYNYYFHTQQIGKAHDLLTYALTTYPSNGDLHYKQARLYAEQKHYYKGVTSVDRALTYSPHHREYTFYKADLLARLDRYHEAISELEMLLAYTSDMEGVWMHMGNIAQICSRPTDSERFYRMALEVNPAYEEALFELAFLLESEDQLERAITLFQDYLDTYPYAAVAWHHLGLAYKKLGQIDKALEAFDFALVIQDDFTTAYFQKGVLLLEKQRYQEAIACFLQVSQYSPKDLHNLYHIAECFENLSLYRDAHRYYHKVTELDPDYVDAWVGMGFCLKERDRHYEALHYYQKAFELDSEHVDLCLALGMCEYKLGHYHTAYQYLERAVSLSPEDVTIWQEWAEMLYEAENYTGAITYLEEAIRLHSQAADLYYHCAAYCYECGMEDKGQMYLENGLLLDHKNHQQIFQIAPSLRSDESVQELISLYC